MSGDEVNFDVLYLRHRQFLRSLTFEDGKEEFVRWMNHPEPLICKQRLVNNIHEIFFLKVDAEEFDCILFLWAF